jgi:hypothetical protein
LFGQFQGAGKIVGSVSGAIPNATAAMASPSNTTEAHAPKIMSEEIRRSRVAMGGYKTVGENKVMSVAKRPLLELIQFRGLSKDDFAPQTF